MFHKALSDFRPIEESHSFYYISRDICVWINALAIVRCAFFKAFKKFCFKLIIALRVREQVKSLSSLTLFEICILGYRGCGLLGFLWFFVCLL